MPRVFIGMIFVFVDGEQFLTDPVHVFSSPAASKQADARLHNKEQICLGLQSSESAACQGIPHDLPAPVSVSRPKTQTELLLKFRSKPRTGSD